MPVFGIDLAAARAAQRARQDKPEQTCRAVSSNSRALRGYHAGILTMVLRLRITMSALPLKAYMLSVSIDVRLVP